jgi:hypothetical protein
VPRFANNERPWLRFASDEDAFLVHGQRFPHVADARRRAVVVQLFLEQVLHVAGDVGRGPCMVWRRAEHDPGEEGQRDTARLVPRSAEVELEPDAGLGDQQVRVARQQGSAGRGARASDRPVVGARRRCGRRRHQQIGHRSPDPLVELSP